MDILLFYIFVFVFGSFFGSFLNVIVDRMPMGKSIVFPPSHCPHCKHRLDFGDLVPIISFFALRRKCRHCKAKISWYYPAVEMLTGIVFMLTVLFVVGENVIIFLNQLAQLWLIIYLLFIISILIIIFFIDLKYGIIPFKIILIALAVITVRYYFFIFQDYSIFVNFLLTGLITFLIFLIVFISSKGRAIGFGDVVYSGFMGYLLGYPNVILGIYIAFLTGALVSFILVLLRKKKYRGGTIPFGPFLTFGTFVSLFWGEEIINWFIKLLNVY